jgi:hypothetical protein
MDAIRQSDDRYRTLESFWKGQINSKVWLIEHLEKYHQNLPYNILVCGGWNGVLATLLFNSNLDITRIVSMDIDKNCEEIAYTMNKDYEMDGRFKAITSDMLTYEDYGKHNLIINTVCEHMTSEQYNEWLDKLPSKKRIVLQSNDYFSHKEHVNCKQTLEEFQQDCKLNIDIAATMPTEKYNRFMIIGHKK